MMGWNKFFLIGNLTRDPEWRKSDKTATEYLKFCVASSAKSKDGKDNTLFMDCYAYGKYGEMLDRFLQKGTAVFVEGELRQLKFMDAKTNEQRSRMTLTVKDVRFLGRVKERDKTEHAENERNAFDAEDATPDEDAREVLRGESTEDVQF